MRPGRVAAARQTSQPESSARPATPYSARVAPPATSRQGQHPRLPLPSSACSLNVPDVGPAHETRTAGCPSRAPALAASDPHWPAPATPDGADGRPPGVPGNLRSSPRVARPQHAGSPPWAHRAPGFPAAFQNDCNPYSPPVTRLCDSNLPVRPHSQRFQSQGQQLPGAVETRTHRAYRATQDLRSFEIAQLMQFANDHHLTVAWGKGQHSTPHLLYRFPATQSGQPIFGDAGISHKLRRVLPAPLSF